jgi:hypothetical protein
MECLKFNIFDLQINGNYLYPLLALSGIAITYLGNKFIKPTLFLSGILVSSTSSYKLTQFILNEINHKDCNIIYGATAIMSISGGFIALKLYKLMNFILGFFTGASFGYLIYISWLHNYNLGVYFIFDNVLWLSTIIPGIISGSITYYKENELSMVLTSLIGPILIIIPLEKLLEKKQYIKNEMLLISIYILTYSFFALTGYRLQKKRNDNIRINYTSAQRRNSLRERQYLENY